MKIEIDTPAPEGWEIYGYGKPQPGDKMHTSAEWVEVNVDCYSACYLLARKKRTLADWANEQELFKALAKMRANKSLDTLAIGYVDNGWWDIVCSGKTFTVDLGIAPSNGTLKLTDGKWELA